MVELSKLDMYLGEYIIKLSLDTEHFLKVNFLHDLTNNDLEYSYNIVNLFLKISIYLSKYRIKKERFCMC